VKRGQRLCYRPPAQTLDEHRGMALACRDMWEDGVATQVELMRLTGASNYAMYYWCHDRIPNKQRGGTITGSRYVCDGRR
jgi:hypothetical protein